MKIMELVTPKKFEFEKETLTDTYGKFKVDPFEHGYGHTIGNALRRILLTSLEGVAVTAVKVKDAMHEYSVVKGAKEDMVQIILNLKKLQFKLFSEGPETIHLKTDKEGLVKASAIQVNQNVEIINPNLVIAHLDAGGDLEMEIEVSRGRGYLPAEREKDTELPVGTVMIDAYFSPVVRVMYKVEDSRVGQMTDYDRLIMEIWTNASISPSDALSRAAEILRKSMAIFVKPGDLEHVELIGEDEKPKESRLDESRMQDILNQPVDIIELSVRASNCLKIARIKTIGDLIRKKEIELLSYKNFGRKSLDEIKERLKELNLNLPE